MHLGPGDSGIPFFAVSAPGVDSLGYALLARYLGEHQSMYKLQGPGPGVWGRPFEPEELRTLAEQYVSAFAQLARTNNSIIVPANLGDISGLIASALQVMKSQQRP